MAMAVFTPILAACGSSADDAAGSGSDVAGDGSSDAPADSQSDTPTESAADGGEETADSQAEDAGGALQWARANLGFVSAYVLARGNSAAIIDTGSTGSADAIGQTLSTLGLNYADVDHVILTHHHGDHIGSIGEVLHRAQSAAVYAGEADLDKIIANGIVPLVGGEDVFGLEIVPTPGHTAGHMSVFDRGTGLLVAGDAIFTEAGAAVEGPERFFADVAQSRQSIQQLAELSFNVMLPGHGDPIESGADAAVAELAATLA